MRPGLGQADAGALGGPNKQVISRRQNRRAVSGGDPASGCHQCIQKAPRVGPGLKQRSGEVAHHARSARKQVAELGHAALVRKNRRRVSVDYRRVDYRRMRGGQAKEFGARIFGARDTGVVRGSRGPQNGPLGMATLLAATTS